MDRNVILTIVVALHCEAKPIIDAYKLKKSSSQAFDHYESSTRYNEPSAKYNESSALHDMPSAGHQVELVVSGIGALAMAAAVGWIGAYQPQRKRAWLNVGTAGHATRELGDIVLVHGAGDEILQRCHYPALVAKWGGETDAVLSVSAPTTDYPGGAAVDMEAYAFFNAALRFSDSELVQSIKVISDNSTSGIENLNAAKLTEFVLVKIKEIMTFVMALSSLIREDFSIEYDIKKLFELRGTHSQRLQVTQLLQKLQVMNSIEPISEQLGDCRNLKQVLQLLTSGLDDVIPSLAIEAE